MAALVRVIIVMQFLVSYVCTGSSKYKPNANFATHFVTHNGIQRRGPSKVISEPGSSIFDIDLILMLL